MILKKMDKDIDKKTKDVLTAEAGKQVTIEALTRKEAAKKVKELREQAEKKGLEASGGFVVFNYEKADEGKKPFSATLKFTDPTNI